MQLQSALLRNVIRTVEVIVYCPRHANHSIRELALWEDSAVDMRTRLVLDRKPGILCFRGNFYCCCYVHTSTEILPPKHKISGSTPETKQVRMSTELSSHKENLPT